MNIHETEILPDEKQSSNYRFRVEQHPLFADGRETRYFGNVRTDTGACIGVVTGQYKVLQTEELLDQCEQMFDSRALGCFKRKEIVTGGGARFRATYLFADNGFKVGKEDLLLKLVIQNSYDGSLRVAFVSGLVRLICANGMTSPMRNGAVNVTRKHTDSLSLDVGYAGRALDSCLNAFKGSRERIEMLTSTQITQIQGRKILNGLVQAGSLSERQSDIVNVVWDNPTYAEDRARSVWNLLNAVTQTTTHQIAPTRWELAERIEGEVTKRLTDAVLHGNLEDLMIDSLPARKVRNSNSN